MTTFPRYMKMLRESRGLSTREVALRTNGRATHTYISMLENGQIASPTIERLEALADVYEVSAVELVQRAYPSLFRKTNWQDLRRQLMALGYPADLATRKVEELQAECPRNVPLRPSFAP